jgi:hypothetical protein
VVLLPPGCLPGGGPWALAASFAAGRPATSLPAGAPVPAGEYPRLTVTAEEVALVKEKSRALPWLGLLVEGMVAQAEAVLGAQLGAWPEKGSDAHLALAQQATALGYAALLTGQRPFADKAKQIILRYADEYLRYPYYPEAHVYEYSLQEGAWLAEIAAACDLLFATGVLSAAQRQHVEQDLLRAAAECVMRDARSSPQRRDGHHQCYNFQAIHCAAVGLVGFLLGDGRLLEWALSDQHRVELPQEGKGIYDFGYGFRHLVKHDVRDDGLFWERSLGYHFFVTTYAAKLCEAALRNGLDLWHLTVPDDSTEDENGSGNYTCDANNGPKCIKFLWDAPLYYAFRDLSLALVADSGAGSLGEYAGLYELAYARYRDPHYAWLLRRIYAQAPRVPLAWRAWSPAGRPRYGVSERGAFTGRYCAWIECPDEQSRGCLVSPRVAVQAGEELDFSVAYRTEEAGAESRPCRVRLELYDAAGQAREIYLPGGEASPRWRVLSHRFVVPAGTVSVGAELFCWYAKGRVYFDAVAFRRPGRAANLLVNGDFEAGADPRTGVLAGGMLPAVLPWNLVEKLPPGAPYLTEAGGGGGGGGSPPRRAAAHAAAPHDLRFASTGVVRSGCSLFPASGFAVLRSPAGAQGLEALLTYGPYGGGHGHKDKLSLVVHYAGRDIVPDLGTAPYGSALQREWTMQTVSHNTVVVDQQTQYPQGTWAHDTSQRPAMGELVCFHADQFAQLARARCGNVYPGVLLDRTLCLVDGVLVDLFAVSSAQEHLYHWVIRSPGRPEGSLPLTPLGAPLGTEQGYQHLRNLQAAAGAGPREYCFRLGGEGIKVTLAGQAGTRFILGEGPVRSAAETMPMLIAERRAAHTAFLAIFRPEADPRPVEAELQQVRGGYWARLRLGHRRYWLLVAQAGEVEGEEGVRLEGKVGVAELDGQGLARASLCSARSLRRPGSLLVALPAPQDVLVEREPKGQWAVVRSWPPVATGGVFIPGGASSAASRWGSGAASPGPGRAWPSPCACQLRRRKPPVRGPERSGSHSGVGGPGGPHGPACAQGDRA